MAKTQTVPTVEYVGPEGQESPVFGSLSPGRVYPCPDPKLLECLVTDNATHWRLPQSKKEE